MSIRYILAAVVVMLGLGVSAQAQPFRIIISETETPLVPNSVMELALQQGYFDREGVKVEFVRVQQTPMVMAALRSGEGEMANVALESLLLAVAQGAQDLRGVMSPNKSLPFMIAGRGVDKAADLNGKRFGIGRIGSVDHLLSMRVLQASGVDTDSLELLALGQPQSRAQAMLAGQIDATTMGIGTFSTLSSQADLSVLVDVDQFYKAAPILSKLNIVRSDTLAQRGDEVQAVIAALTLAARDFETEPQAWITAMQQARPDVDLIDLQMLAGAFEGSWSVNGGLSAVEIQAAQDWLHSSPDFEGIPPATLDQIVDLAPLEAVLKRIGRSDLGDLAWQ